MDTTALSNLPQHRAQPPSAGGQAGRDSRALARPGSCRERGVTVPFTSPQLHAMRLRADAAGRPEVMVPNPSGREGWFVLGWSAVVERFQPSLADRALMGALAPGHPTPATLRAAAWRVAAQGLAGRAARRAAEAVALRGPATLASRLALIESFLHEMKRLREQAPMEPDRRFAEGLCAHGSAALAAAMAQPSGEALGAERREWLLDGWELLAAAWSAAPVEDHPALLRRTASLAPPVPLEAEGWAGGAALAAAGSPRGDGAGGAVAQEVAEAAFARWLGG